MFLLKWFLKYHHHHPINVSTAGAQAFPMDGIERLGHDPPRGPSVDWWTTAAAAIPAATAVDSLTFPALPRLQGPREALESYLVTETYYHQQQAVLLTSDKSVSDSDHLHFIGYTPVSDTGGKTSFDLESESDLVVINNPKLSPIYASAEQKDVLEKVGALIKNHEISSRQFLTNKPAKMYCVSKLKFYHRHHKLITTAGAQDFPMDGIRERVATNHAGPVAIVILIRFSHFPSSQSKLSHDVTVTQIDQDFIDSKTAFPMDGIGRLGHDPPRGPSADWRVLMTAYAAGTNGLTCLPKHGGTRDSKFLVTHPMTDHCESC
ncbi:unnamed protein product [Chilo suppressalis]|uniref:Uncharacterized protein n=1 Tax=Chilo suppressalis TaxID=168631 RepID=A0ABN8B502_CHISP|nr:unnamed protein product [Chilo suppressalis]